MANPEHVAKLAEGVEAWNDWRRENPWQAPNLSGANLSKVNLEHANLQGADLSGTVLVRANLRDVHLMGAKLIGANLFSADLSYAEMSDGKIQGAILDGANLSEADLRRADLSEANLSDAKISSANLDGAILFRAYCGGANFIKASLSGANLEQAALGSAILREADLEGANLKMARLSGADLRDSNLSKCNLFGTDFRAANLQGANLDRANLNDAKLWETLRAGWSISDITCERVFWDEAAKITTVCAPGEFERLYSDQTTIELFYEGGISSFELNTLPALLQHLASKHPDTSIHLKTIEQTGGGAKITINLGNADDSLREKIQTEAAHVVRAQLSLRENENLRLQIQNDLLREQYRETIHLMLSAGGTHFHGDVGTAIVPSGNAKVDLHQTFNDNTALIQLIDNLLTRNTELTAAQSSEIEEAKAELQKPEPQKSRLSSFYGFLKTIPKEAILKGAGKLGEKAAEADWSSLLHQLGEVIHHLH